jgi:tetratricopeptide (TPR) repeat protein
MNAPPAAVARQKDITRLVQRGEVAAAERLCRALIAEFPQFAPGWSSASLIALRRGESAQALRLIDEALARAPQEAHFLLHRAHCLLALQRVVDALACAGQAERAAQHDAGVLNAIGTFYSLAGEHGRALAVYSRAIDVQPGESRHWFNRAAVRRFLGELAQAESDYDRAIALAPRDFEAYLNRSELRPQSAARNHVAELEGILASGVGDWRGEVQLRYALAKEYEDLADHTRSWRELTCGARLRRAHLQYDINRDVATAGWIMEAYPAAPPSVEAAARPTPIFIVGLPRSGSTLVERILGSHSSVFAAGELPHFAAALVDAVRARNGGRALSRQELVAASRDIDYAALGADYLARTRAQAAQRARFTDKMPLNYLYCGLIRRALPGAPIVHVVRHPLAVCYAMYKTLFHDGYPFSYDLHEIALYYGAYRRLMNHWRATLSHGIIEVSYERLVRDPQGEARGLLEACGLEWEEGCLAFHRNPSATTTASAPQVRRPIYDSSVAQWRHYAHELEDLHRELIAAGIEPRELD